jgi:hypothetical protein
MLESLIILDADRHLYFSIIISFPLSRAKSASIAARRNSSGTYWNRAALLVPHLHRQEASEIGPKM